MEVRTRRRRRRRTKGKFRGRDRERGNRVPSQASNQETIQANACVLDTGLTSASRAGLARHGKEAQQVETYREALFRVITVTEQADARGGC